jgi:TPR repeat protein
MSGNGDNCPFCKSDRTGKTDGEKFEEIMKRVEVNDAYSMCVLADQYIDGNEGLLQDSERAIELWKQAAALGSSKAHCNLGDIYRERGNSKKEKFHFEAAAMAGHEIARC